MAKKNNSVAFKDVLNVDTLEITEKEKGTNAELIYDLLKTLKDFDGKEVSITIKEENAVIPKNIDLNVSDDTDDDNYDETYT